MPTAYQVKYSVKAVATPSAKISSSQRGLPVNCSITSPTRMISPFLKVCARPRTDIAAGGLIVADLPPDRHVHHDEEDQHHEAAGGVAGVEIKPIEKDAHHSL